MGSQHPTENKMGVVLQEGPAQITSVSPLSHAKGHREEQRTHVRTLVLLIPRYGNPDQNGHREPIDPTLLDKTLTEIRTYFSGYTSYRTEGWYRDGETGEEFFDEHIRFEIDCPFNDSGKVLLTSWKRKLEDRFHQRCIYMKLLGPVICV